MKLALAKIHLPVSLFGNVVGAAGIGCVIDGLIFRFAPEWTQSISGLPPGWVVGCVWILLFGLLGAARWEVLRTAPESRTPSIAIVLLLLFCASYPLYTDTFRSFRVEIAGDVLTIVFAVIVAAVSSRSSKRASAFVLPVAVWVMYATFATLKAQPWG